MYNDIRLEKGLYNLSGKSFTAALEELDPSGDYCGTPLEKLDAYERQLKRFDIYLYLSAITSEFQERTATELKSFSTLRNQLCFSLNSSQEASERALTKLFFPVFAPLKPFAEAVSILAAYLTIRLSIRPSDRLRLSRLLLSWKAGGELTFPESYSEAQA